MKAYRLYGFAGATVSLLMLAGCATPLNLETDGAAVAQLAGVEQSKIEILTYCIFNDVHRDTKVKSLAFNEGIFALVDDHIKLFLGKLHTPDARQVLDLAISDINGVDQLKLGVARQLQLLLVDEVIVLQLTENKAFGSNGVQEALYQKLLAKGVPKWTGHTYYVLDPFGAP